MANIYDKIQIQLTKATLLVARFVYTVQTLGKSKETKILTFHFVVQETPKKEVALSDLFNLLGETFWQPFTTIQVESCKWQTLQLKVYEPSLAEDGEYVYPREASQEYYSRLSGAYGTVKDTTEPEQAFCYEIRSLFDDLNAKKEVLAQQREIQLKGVASKYKKYDRKTDENVVLPVEAVAGALVYPERNEEKNLELQLTLPVQENGTQRFIPVISAEPIGFRFSAKRSESAKR